LQYELIDEEFRKLTGLPSWGEVAHCTSLRRPSGNKRPAAV
jgi:hypothetical protein